MGTWGTAIFADDTAADVRDAWRAAIIDGLAAAAATSRVLETFADGVLDDPDESKVFWLALAAAQFESGRLEAAVRDRALAIIDGGGDVARWEEEDAVLARQREKVLERLALKLRGPQPKRKRLRRPPSYGVPVELGDVVFVRNRERGLEVLFAVVRMSVGRGRDPWPEVEPLLWQGGDVPSRDQLAGAPALVEEALLPMRWTRMTDMERAAARPLRTKLFIVATTRKDDVFGPHIGEVVAKGVPRSPSGHYGPQGESGPLWIGSVTWPELVDWIGGRDYLRALELTGEELRATP